MLSERGFEGNAQTVLSQGMGKLLLASAGVGSVACFGLWLCLLLLFYFALKKQ